MTSKDLGLVTAYAYAVSQGYTGTEEEFAELMASYATVAEEAAESAAEAAASATAAGASETNAASSAASANQSATSAGNSATSASGSAVQAQASATAAGQSATQAAGSATAAGNSATAAAGSASQAAASETAAGASATAAAGSATSAASSATAAAGSATEADASADRAQEILDSIPEDYSELSDDVADLKSAFSEFPEGSYPDMTVGGVMSVEDGAEDQVPYTFRASGGGVAVGNREIDQLVGGTVAWNQRVTITVSEFNYNGITYTRRSDGFVLVDGTATGNSLLNVGDTIHGINDHVVFLRGCPDRNGHTFYGRDGYTTNKYDVGQGLILKKGSDNLIYQIVVPSGETVNNVVFKPQIFDLTAMFGSTIADYVYALETATAGAGVAWFRRLFPNDYYAYDAGTLKSVEGVSAHVMRDADDNIIGTYPLDSSLTLRGIPKLDAANRLYYDGDTYQSDGTVTRKYGVVDLGTLTWYYRDDVTPKQFRATLPQAKSVSGGSAIANMICPAYQTSSFNGLADGDKRIARFFANLNGLNVRDDSYTDAAAFAASLSGVYLVYELATPTTEQADPYTNPQIVDNLGTEEYVTTGIVPVGHYTQYPTDIVAKVDGLPSDFSTLIAVTETGYKASRVYSVNNFLIVSNQLYRVTASIASGATITPGTNVTAVTVADILTQLLNA